ncbi:hypothetical protein LSAT2_011797 [Lamellibrachia satsuma]|nr:hypothetical protein LSAT2_011797 [Lamellibrachia satsuma]
MCSRLSVAVCSVYIAQSVCPSWTFDDTAFAKLDLGFESSDEQVAKRRHVRDAIDTTQPMFNTTDKPSGDNNSRLSLIAGAAAAIFIVVLIIIVAIVARRSSSSNQRSGRTDSAPAQQRSQRPPEMKTESGERVFQINLAFDNTNADGDRVVIADGNTMYSK